MSEHGNRNTYKRGCRCDDCRDANTQWQRDRRRRIAEEAAASVPTPPSARTGPMLATRSAAPVGRRFVAPDPDPGDDDYDDDDGYDDDPDDDDELEGWDDDPYRWVRELMAKRAAGNPAVPTRLARPGLPVEPQVRPVEPQVRLQPAGRRFVTLKLACGCEVGADTEPALGASWRCPRHGYRAVHSTAQVAPRMPEAAPPRPRTAPRPAPPMGRALTPADLAEMAADAAVRAQAARAGREGAGRSGRRVGWKWVRP